ncbi:MAG: oligosaccharide flippase family protein, partial [Deltaproteobacteria bacterium]|nr:oligosaccharide flippase family protein [Deltaproteobacteria bacterium]
MASRSLDRLLISRFFGPAVAGRYNLAYNLADIPAMHVGEHIGDVLLPSFARMDPEDRAAALTRATRLLALVIFPLAVGLGVIAETVTLTVFDNRWASMAPMLLILSSLSVVRPVGWTVSSFQVASQRPRVVMYLEITKVTMLLASLYVASHFGVLWACLGVGVAFTIHAAGA